MKKRRPKQQRGERTKKQILKTALKLFSEKGYENVTVDEIVKASNSSKGSFYLHFGSKHNIFLEKFKEIDDYYVQAVKEFPPNLTAPEKLLLFVQKQMDFIQYELGKDLMRVIYSSALLPNQNRYFLDQERPLFVLLASIIKEGQENEEIKKDILVDELKLMILQGLMGAIYHWCMSDETYNLQMKSEKLFYAMIKGIMIK